MINEKFYSIGRGSLNLNGKFYYGLDYAITDFMRNIEQQNTNLKQVLNEIREIIVKHKQKDDHLYLNEWQTRDILQIIDKVDDNNDK